MRYSSEDGKGTLALDGLSFSVEKGESVAIIGPSGCGKSSTLQMAAGLLQPTSGKVTIDGAPVTAPRQDTSLILQDFGLLPWKTVRDNAELGLKIHGVGKAERRQRAERALGLVGLQDFAQAYPSGLSGGMRQRLALARSLALDVDLLLMDEPLSALDALLREQLQDTLLALWQAQGYAQILVTHSIEEAVFLGQRILVLTPRPGRRSRTRRARAPAASSPSLTTPTWDPTTTVGATRSSSAAPIFARSCAPPWRRPRRHRMRKLMGYLWGTVFVIALWWALALAIGSPALPTPDATWPALVDNFARIMPEFWTSLGRIALSMLIGTVLGVPAGLWIGRSRRGDQIFGPVLYVLYPVPKIVFLPVLFILFGLGGQAKVILIAIAIFFQMVVTMRDAAKNVPQGAVVSLRSLGATKGQILREVVLPASLPDLFTALRITTGTAVAVLFIAESMAGSSGLGYYIMHAWSLLEYEQMFAGIIAMAVLGVVIYEVFEILEYRLTKWRRA